MGAFVGGLITVVVIIIGLIQTIAPVFKAIAEANEKAKQEALTNSGRVRQQNSGGRGSFLPEMTQQQQGVQRPVAGSQQPGSPGKTGTSRNKAGNTKKKQVADGEKPKPKSAKTTQRSGPGSGVASHVDSFIGQHVESRIGNQIGNAVKSDINDHVRSHLGDDRNKAVAPVAATTHGSAAASDLLAALRSPQGVQQAILMNEILAKPKALRKS